ncbi:urea transporter [Desulfovibrio inopinatus]|uniref:urea transporter n=1 Tax=Desulfovibrio inopinatus TaxID=102109 RepID=UPI000487E9B2|nr:urea transporter [Desulfovibrio inopinatus]
MTHVSSTTWGHTFKTLRRTKVFSIVRRLGSGIGSIFFIPSARFGLLAIGLAFIAPVVAAFGMLGLIAGQMGLKLLGANTKTAMSEVHIANAFLIGCYMGIRYVPTLESIALVAIAAIFTAVMTVVLAYLLDTWLGLPALSLPFALVGISIALASPNWPMPQDVFIQWFNPTMPPLLAGYFRALGSILFMPSVLAGLVLSLCLLASSRILFVLSFIGFGVGVGTRILLLNDFSTAATHSLAFNDILTAMAIGGALCVPTGKHYLLAAGATVWCALIGCALNSLGVAVGAPVLTLPFVLSTLPVFFAARLLGAPSRAAFYARSPELAVIDHAVWKERARIPLRLLYLPFSGPWTVWQGVDGPWTHKGVWRNAYDFIITNDDGLDFVHDGSLLTDFFAFGKPVVAPCRGRIVSVMNDLPDNPIGMVDTANSWGNAVVIEHPDGYWVELSHFRQGSIRVEPGQWIEAGTLLGACGNSGNSPRPHIHIQVQTRADLGAPTLPFGFSHYVVDDVYVAGNQPQTDDKLAPLPIDMQRHAGWELALDTSMTFCLNSETASTAVTMTVGMADDGSRFLETENGRLYYANTPGSLLFLRHEGNDPSLALIFAAMPRLPFGGEPGITWTEPVPATLPCFGWRRFLAPLLASFHHRLGVNTAIVRLTARNTLQTELRCPITRQRMHATIQLHEHTGHISALKLGSHTLKAHVQPQESIMWLAA